MEHLEREADGVGEGTGIKMYSNHIIQSDVLVVIEQIAEARTSAPSRLLEWEKR